VKPHVMHLLNSFQVGGAECVALNLARSINPSRFRVSVCSMGGSGPMEGRFRDAGIDTACIDPVTGPLRKLRTCVRIAAVLREFGVTILQCHNALPVIYGPLAARLAGVQVVLSTRHSLSLTRKCRQPWILERAVKPLTSHFIAVAEFVHKRGVRTRRITRERCAVIYNGVDTSRLVPASGRKSQQLPCVIGCVARLSHEKCHADLIGAVAELVRNETDVVLELVGDGAMRPALEELAHQLGIGDRVRFLGTRSDVPVLLRGFDIFVLPSRFEGLPLTILEAMASGLPVVSTKVGGIPELVEDGKNGLLVEPQRPAELAAAIRRLVEDVDLRHRMGRAGRKLAVEKFDLAVAARRHEELYVRLLRQKGIRVGDA